MTVLSCSRQKETHPPPASVSNPVTEASLTTVTLTPEAVERLGIETEQAQLSLEPPARTVGGEVIVPPGQTLLVTAPMAGTVLAPGSGSVPAGGTRVRRGQVLMRLVGLPAERDLLRTEQEVAATEARLREAQAQAQRVARLFEERLVPAQENERAAADLDAARAAYEGAAAQQQLMRGVPRDGRGLTPLAITAPHAGVVRSLSVAPGQAVAAGAPLAEIVRLDRLWIRVPVYAGNAGLIARQQPAAVHPLSAAAGPTSLRAVPVNAPPAADASSSSIYLFYEVGGATALRPGERVGVTIPLIAEKQNMLSVPIGAVVRDMSGGAWVYVRTGATAFARRRIEITRVEADRAFVARGLEAGVPVVTAGAAELFGTEFGAGK